MSELIKIRGLQKHYVMGSETVKALKGVDLSIYKNDYIALMGPSGSGKSTLMNLLGCLDTPTSGDYWLAGKETSKMTEDELAQIRNEEIGFVFQAFNLLSRLSSMENVALPLIYAGKSRKAREERAVSLLEGVNLGLRVNHKPNELSGGEKQRVAIARALVNDPSIILADEPTGNLDTKTSYQIMDIFEKIYREGNTVIIVTHEEDIAKYARRIIRLKDGIIEKDEKNPEPVLEMSQV